MKKNELLRRFIALRKHRNRNQANWGEHTGKSREHQNRCENGRAPLTADDLLAIAEAEGLHPADFFCFNPDTRQVEYPSDPTHLRKIAALEKMVEQLQAHIAHLDARIRGGRSSGINAQVSS